MSTIQQSIEVNAPVSAVFDRLSRFEDYPQFMTAVERVQQIDDSHLHWSARTAQRSVEWDAEITERDPGRCIAWHNTSGPPNAGRVELRPLGQQAARVTVMLSAMPGKGGF
jgi:uncharacterized membrane protein